MPTTEVTSDPEAGRGPAAPAPGPGRPDPTPEADPTDEASAESFPASDPPSFTPLTAGPPPRP